MPGYRDPLSDIEFGFVAGEDGWGPALNRAFRRLSYLPYSPSVKSRTLSTPPASPSEGDKYVVAASPTGAWATYSANDIAVWGRGLTTPATLAWQRFPPSKGLILYDEATDEVVKYDGTSWASIGGGASATPATKPIWTYGTPDRVQGRLSAGIWTSGLLGQVDLSPIGPRLVTGANYGVAFEANASPYMMPVDGIFRITLNDSDTLAQISTKSLTAGYDLTLGDFISSRIGSHVDTRGSTKFNITGDFYSATGGDYDVTLTYVAGPKLT